MAAVISEQRWRLPGGREHVAGVSQRSRVWSRPNTSRIVPTARSTRLRSLGRRPWQSMWRSFGVTDDDPI